MTDKQKFPIFGTPNISGKIFLTEKEAAYCACVSVSQFRKLAPGAGISNCLFMGKKIYRQEDILECMNDAWNEAHSYNSPMDPAAVEARDRNYKRKTKLVDKLRGSNSRSLK